MKPLYAVMHWRVKSKELGQQRNLAEPEVELDKAAAEDKGPATAPPTADNTKTLFGVKRSTPTVKKV